MSKAAAKLKARVDRAIAAANKEDLPLAERLGAYMNGGTCDDGLKAELLRLQLKVAQDRLAIALAWFRREHLYLESEHAMESSDLALMIDVVTDGDGESARKLRNLLRQQSFYKASLNRIADWLADGAIAAVLKRP